MILESKCSRWNKRNRDIWQINWFKKSLHKRENVNVLCMCVFVCICPAQLLLSALNEKCQVSTVQHWEFFKVSLAQSAMNYWAWASSMPVLFVPLLTVLFFSMTMKNQISKQDSMNILSVGTVILCLTSSRGRSDTEQERFSLAPGYFSRMDACYNLKCFSPRCFCDAVSINCMQMLGNLNTMYLPRWVTMFVTTVSSVSVCWFAHKHGAKPKRMSKHKDTHACACLISSSLLPKFSSYTFYRLTGEFYSSSLVHVRLQAVLDGRLYRHFPWVEGLTLIPDHSEPVCCNLHACVCLNRNKNQPLTSVVGCLLKNRIKFINSKYKTGKWPLSPGPVCIKFTMYS